MDAMSAPDSVAVIRKEKTLGLNLEQKQAVVAEVSAEVAKAQAIVLAEYRSLPVGEHDRVAQKARTSGVYLRVLKNTLARRAVAETPFAGLTEKMVGPLAYGISADPVAVAKVLHEFAKEQREVRDQGRRDAERGHDPAGGRGSRQDAEPPAAARARCSERCRRRSRSSRGP